MLGGKRREVWAKDRSLGGTPWTLKHGLLFQGLGVVRTTRLLFKGLGAVRTTNT